VFVPYDTVQDRVNRAYGGRSVYFLGQGHCGNSGPKSLAASYSNCPATDRSFYEPVSVTRNEDNTHQKGRTNAVPPYRYTSRYVSKVTTENFLLRRANGGDGVVHYEQDGINAETSPTTCANQVTAVRAIEQALSYTEVTHLFPYTTYNKHTWDQTAITNAINAVQNDVSLKALSTYDILTDVAESREIPKMVRSMMMDVYNVYRSLRNRHSLPDLRRAAHLRPRDLLRSSERAMRKIGDQWMQYRYGIMPLVYSGRDIAKLAKAGQERRHKKTIVITPKATGVSLPGSSNYYIWTETVGDIKISANVFQWFEWRGEAQFQALGFNPLVTAWELIPYSFVADWFVNIGDYITRKTSASATRTQWACVSRRESHVKSAWAHYKNEDMTVYYSNRVQSSWAGENPPAAPIRTIKRPEGSFPLQRVTTDVYQRWLFGVHDARLDINPSLNWRRGIDSAVMSINQLGRLVAYLSKR